MNDKHKLFVAEYIKHNCNGTKAYMAVYTVNPNVAKINASRLLSKANIKDAVNKEIARVLDDKKELTLQVVNEYKKIAFSDVANYINPKTGKNVVNDNTDTSPIKSIQFDIIKKNKEEVGERFKFELYNKQSALDSISKLILGLSEKQEVEHSGAQVIYLDKQDEDL